MSTTPLTWRIDVGSPGVTSDLPELWRGDPQGNPFASPSFLAIMHAATARRATPVWALGRAGDGTLAAAWALRLDGHGTLQFLPVGYSDQSTCLALPAVGEADLAAGLALAIRETQATSLALQNLPPWGPTLGAVREALRGVGWPYRDFPAWSCPVLRVEPGPEAAATLRAAIDAHKRVRGYANALRREPAFAFEVLEDGAELDEWCRDFCDVHEARWRDTPTPSVYRTPTARTLLRRTLESWCADGVLVRFAIRLAAGRVALVAALRAGRRLVYYHVVRSPEAERSRAGHVMIRLIGLWMSERGYDTLDFGAGGEDYKARYANADDRLWRVFASSRVLSQTYARALVEERIRRSPALQRAWDAWAHLRPGELRRWLTATDGPRAAMPSAGDRGPPPDRGA